MSITVRSPISRRARTAPAVSGRTALATSIAPRYWLSRTTSTDDTEPRPFFALAPDGEGAVTPWSARNSRFALHPFHGSIRAREWVSAGRKRRNTPNPSGVRVP